MREHVKKLVDNISPQLTTYESLVVWDNCIHGQTGWKLYLRYHDLGGTGYRCLCYLTQDEAKELVVERRADDLYGQLREQRKPGR